MASLMLLVATITSVYIQNKAEAAAEELITYEMHFDTSKPFEELSEKEKEVRPYHVLINRIIDNTDFVKEEIENKSFVNNMTKNFSVSWMTYLAGIFIVIASFGDWCRIRKR